jgi:hypothetical protein
MSRRLKRNQPENDKDEISIEEIHEEQDAELNKFSYNKNYFFTSSYDLIIYTGNFMYKSFKFIIKVSGIYIVWIFLHYIASHLYIKFCVPTTFAGFIMSPFMAATPHCQGLRWVVYNAANMINNMWVILGTWICSTILLVNHETSSDASRS